MVWSKAKLDQLVGERLAKRKDLGPVEQAALAYARWQGLTDEVGVDPDRAKADLDATLDGLDWLKDGASRRLIPLAEELGEPAIIGLMKYSLERDIAQVREMQPTTSMPTVPLKKKRRDRER
ncbi:MAG: hypothetical protein AB7P16_27650 [Bradyrhizobium sp.]|uniref:hypothetical protein n=1 Tax=Bradyrhizobium sp. TaxID=376 RepID=UPI003D0EDFED